MLSSCCTRLLVRTKYVSSRDISTSLKLLQLPPSMHKPFISGLTDEAKAVQTAIKRLVPMFDRVLVLKAEATTRTEGGIVLPEKSQKKVLTGTVVAVGPGNRNQNGEVVPIQVAIGDKVLLPEYGGTKVEMEANKEYFLFRESDILAKLEM